MSKNLSELSGRKGVEENLFDKMGKLAVDTGAPSKEQLEELAEEFLIGKSTTYGTTTFYDFLRPENKGKKVYVCNGSACLCAGTQPKVIEQLSAKFDPFFVFFEPFVISFCFNLIQVIPTRCWMIVIQNTMFQQTCGRLDKK